MILWINGHNSNGRDDDMSKLTVACLSASMVAAAMIMMADMSVADDVEHAVHKAKKALKETL